MSKYRIIFDESYDFLTMENDSDVKRLRRKLHTAKPLNEKIGPIALTKVRESRNAKGLADFPGFSSSGLLMTPYVKNLLVELNTCGEWIEMNFKDEKYYYFHTTKTEDAMDMKRSELSFYDGYITGVRKLILKENAHEENMIFKLLNYQTYPPIASQNFVDIVKGYELSGLIFEEIEQ